LMERGMSYLLSTENFSKHRLCPSVPEWWEHLPSNMSFFLSLFLFNSGYIVVPIMFRILWGIVYFE
jgi:hypothetical protein